MARTTAWKNSELYFEGESLSVVVEEFNRYSARRIVIADPSIAHYQVGGTCKAIETEACASVAERALGVIVLPPDPAEPTTIRLGRATAPPANHHD
jgi:transmembrane sensor